MPMPRITRASADTHMHTHIVYTVLIMSFGSVLMRACFWLCSDSHVKLMRELSLNPFLERICVPFLSMSEIGWLHTCVSVWMFVCTQASR